jgi:SAM-dependent methyltransferase
VTTAQQHYAELLAPIYVWMAGGLEAALATGARDVGALVPGRGLAVDLGAGFGMHSIPLARGGYHVVAIDTSRQLLDVLRAESVGLPIRVIEDDLLDFRRHIVAPATLIVCLGDTLTHLAEPSDVERLCRDIASSLEPGGRVVLTFRDYSRPATGTARFIPVRSDADRIHTCFLEQQGERLHVHDIVHERDGAMWRVKIGSYPKLRLAPDAVEAMLRRAGLTPTVAAGPRGMTAVTAIRG